MQQPQRRFLPVAGPASRTVTTRRMAYWDWPARSSQHPPRVVICVHGLSRQGRDFDTLAQALNERARVVAVDVAGRGESDWLQDPSAYQVPTYTADLAALVLQLRAEQPDVLVDWVGTSMGGLIGMAIAAQPALAVRRLVLNDVGPVIEWPSLQRIGSYLGQDPEFPTEQAGVDYLASISSGFGPHTPAQWLALSRPMLRERDGQWRLHYDPSIALAFKALTTGLSPDVAQQTVRDGEAALWGLYEAIKAPTLLLRGADSDLLSRETAAEMGRRGPRARCVEFKGVGHAPTLVAVDQIAVVQAFLDSA
jgi:pimeloyl-ACP methyl ester carboxylesterase